MCIHVLGGFLAPLIDQLCEMLFTFFIFFPFCFRSKAVSSLYQALDLSLKNLLQFPPDFYKLMSVGVAC